jgi:hypothetical protein
LLPLPQTIAIRPAGARCAATRARPSPARSIRSSTETLRSVIAQRSSSRISPASSSGSIQRGRLIAPERYLSSTPGSPQPPERTSPSE